MIRRLLPARLVLLIAFLVTSAHAQLTWTEQTSGATDQLRDVWAADASNIWIVGNGGRIMKSSGNGTWTTQTSGTTGALIEVWGTSATNLWAVGASGRILRGDGTTWTSQTSGTTNTLFSLWGSSASNVWAAGDQSTLTRWNGTSWTTSSLGVGTNVVCNGLWGSASNNIWLVGTHINTGNGRVYLYNGTSWTEDSSMGTVAGLNDVWGSGANDVWAVGVGGLILRWNGTAWSTVSSGTTQELLSVWGTSATNVYATSAEGGIFRFDGTSWTKDSYSSIERLNSVMGTSANSVHIAGGSFQVATILAGAPAAVPTAPPTVTTTLPGTIGSTTVVMGGNVTADGGGPVLERGIVWGTAANPTTANNKFPIGAGMGSFSGTVTGLPPTTTVFARAFARNSLFTGYGAETSFTTLSNNADLSALTTTAGTLSPAFATGTTSYTTPNVANGITSVTVTPTRAAATSTLQVRVNGGTYATVTSGSASVDLPLNVGSNTINVLVTAQDGSTTKAYTLTVTRAAPVLAGDPITPTAVIVTSQWVGPIAGVKENIINGTGLSGGGSVLSQTHDAVVTADTMWHAGPNAGDISGGVTGPLPFGAPPVNTQAVEFDLGANYDLSAAHIWNMNQVGFIGRGVKDVQILVSSATTGAFTALTTAQFTQGTGVAGLAAQVVPLTGATNVRRVRFSIQTAWSGAASDYVGLSEVRFQGTPYVASNTAPVLGGLLGPFGATESGPAQENTTSAIPFIGVSDADSGQTHTWALSGADAGKFQLTAHPTLTGAFQLFFNTAPDFETPTDADTNGIYEVTVTVTDNGSPAASDSVALRLTITDANDAPSIAPIDDQSTMEDTPITIPFIVGDQDAGQDLDELEITAQATDESTGDPSNLFPVENIVLGGSGANRTLTLTPAPNANGTATITVQVSDGQTEHHTTSRTFTLTVTPLNDAPTFTLAENITRFPGSGYTQAGFVSAISPGPADESESGQTVTLSLTGNTDPGLFTVPPTLAADGSLSFTPGNTPGVSTLTVRAQDSGGTDNGGVNFTEQTFTITISVFNLRPAGEVWTARMTDANRNWSAITSSADGSKLAAVVVNGQIYTSIDSGVTWTARDSNRNWRAITSSADGSKLAAVVFNGQIYTSTDSGETWMPRDQNRRWQSITSSADGSKLAAVVGGGQIYTSTDSGVTWEARMTDADRTWVSITSSADGSKLAAVVFGGQIYTSTDSGANWTAREQSRDWSSITSSADGSKLAAAVGGETDVARGLIYTSTDSGVTWLPRLEDLPRPWGAITSSADGTKLSAALAVFFTYGAGEGEFPGVYTSTNSGANWAKSLSRVSLGLRSVTSSADGNKLAATTSVPGRIYTSEGSSLPDVAAGRAFTLANFTSADASSGVVSYTVTNSNPALFAVQPAIAANGTLTLTAGQNAGTATVSVTANYNGGAATSPPQTFPINVTKPLKMERFLFGKFELAPDQGVKVNEAQTDVGVFVGTYYDALSNFPVVISGPDAALLQIDPTGFLQFKTPPSFANGRVYDITLSAGSATSPLGMASARLRITDQDVNQPPSFTKGADQSLRRIVAPQFIPGWATAISDGDAAVTQALTFTITPVSGANLLSVPPAIDPATGNLTFTPSGSAGTARYRVTLTDDNSINGTPALTTAEQFFDLVFIEVPAGTGTAEFTAWPALATLPADQRGPNATPANDGVSNLLKFALGIGPLDSANGFIPQGVTQGSGTAAGFPTISFIRKKGLIDVAVNVEVGSSLDFTTTTLGSVITGVQDLGNGTERVTVRSTAPFTGNAMQFFRLKVTAN